MAEREERTEIKVTKSPFGGVRIKLRLCLVGLFAVCALCLFPTKEAEAATYHYTNLVEWSVGNDGEGIGINSTFDTGILEGQHQIGTISEGRLHVNGDTAPGYVGWSLAAGKRVYFYCNWQTAAAYFGVRTTSEFYAKYGSHPTITFEFDSTNLTIENCSGGTATCTTRPSCAKCGNPYGSALGHDFTSKTTTNTYLKSSATCVDPASYYYKCSRCTAKGTSTYSSGNALGHSYDGGVVTTAPTVYDTGVRTHTCTRSGCTTSTTGHTKTEVIDKLNWYIWRGNSRIEKLYLGETLIYDAYNSGYDFAR